MFVYIQLYRLYIHTHTHICVSKKYTALSVAEI